MIERAYGISQASIAMLRAQRVPAMGGQGITSEQFQRAADAIKPIPLHVGLIADAIATGNDPRTLAAHFAGTDRLPGSGTYDIGRLTPEKLHRKRELFESLRKQRGLDIKNHDAPAFLHLPSGRWARLNGKHRIGFLLYLGIESAHVAMFGPKSIPPELVAPLETDVGAR